jgi:radical SAM protein with 4Fe4S-binding SPASM domain
MSQAYAIRIIQENIRPQTKDIYLYFFGGEPTLNMPTLKTVVEYVKSLKLQAYFIINTNGTAPDDVLEYLIGNDFVVSLSSDGIPPITDYHRLSKSGLLVSKSVEHSIRKLVNAGSLFQVRATITKWNISSLIESIRYWASLGVRFVHLEPVGPSCNSMFFIESKPDRDEYVSAILSAIDEAEKLGVYIINSAYMNLMSPSTYFCTMTAGEKELYTTDGAISMCYRVQSKKDQAQEFIKGTYDPSTDTFQDGKESLKHFEVTNNEPCSTCHARYICAGGCPYRNKERTGSIYGIDEWMCFIKKQLVHDAILRIDNSINNGELPVIFGQTIFENLVAENPRGGKTRGGKNG